MKTISNLAKSNIKLNKNRSILTVITIVLTTCLLTAVGIICANWGEVNLYTAKQFYGSHHARFSKSTANQNEKLATHLDIDAMQVVKTLGTYKDKETNTSFTIQYTDVINNKYLSERTIKEGNLPIKSNEIIITEGYMTSLGKSEPKIGDTISIKYESRNDGQEKVKDFVVSGIIKSSEDTIKQKSFYGLVSKEYLINEEYSEDTTFTTYVTFKNKGGLNEYEVQYMLDEITANFNIPASNAKVNTDYLRANKPDSTIIGGGIGIAFLIIMSSMLVIYSIFYIAVINKVQEYGKLKAIGATKKQIKNLILKEGMTLALIAIPFGLLLGYGVGKFAVAKAIAGTTVGTGKYDLAILIIAAIASIFTVYISILKPMKVATKISPVEAMKYNGEDGGKAKTREGYKEMTVSRLVKANLKRNKKRTLITLISLCLSGILFIVSSTILNSISVEEMTDHGFEGAAINVNLTNYSLESLENPEKELYNVQQNNPVTNIIESIKSIDGVKDVITQKSTLLNDVDREEWFSISIADEKDIKDAVLAGEIDFDKLISGNGIILDHPSSSEYYGLEVGDKVRFEIIVNGNKEIKEFTIIAITDNTVGSTFILPDSVYNGLFNYDTTSGARVYINDKDMYEQVKKSVGKNIKNETFLDATYYDEAYKSNENAVRATKFMAYALVIVIGIIGLINLINTMVTSIVVRKKELGILQAIGLSNKQFIKMIQLEGLFYVGTTIVTTLTLGNVIGYIAYIMFKNSGASYAIYSYPVIQTVLLIVLTVLAEILISYSIIKSFNKDSLVDRVRYSE